MNEEIREFAEELQDFLKKGHKLLNKMGQGMGQGGYGENVGQWFRNNFGGQGFDPRFM